MTPAATHSSTAVLTRLIARLVTGTLALWFVAGLAVHQWRGPDDVLPSAPAALLCLFPATLTLWWAGRAGLRGDAQGLMVAFVGGMLLRLAVVLGGALACYYLVPAFHRPALWAWVVLFYLFTLGLETSLALRLLSRPDAPDGRSPS